MMRQWGPFSKENSNCPLLCSYLQEDSWAASEQGQSHFLMGMTLGHTEILSQQGQLEWDACPKGLCDHSGLSY